MSIKQMLCCDGCGKWLEEGQGWVVPFGGTWRGEVVQSRRDYCDVCLSGTMEDGVPFTGSGEAAQKSAQRLRRGVLKFHAQVREGWEERRREEECGGGSGGASGRPFATRSPLVVRGGWT